MTTKKKTITEALAEIKTLEKRLNVKRQFAHDHLFLAGNAKDPLEKEGGSVKALAETRQAITDMELRIVAIRSAINKVNMTIDVTVCGTTRTLAEWIIWAREVAPKHEQFIKSLAANINAVRNRMKPKNVAIVEGQGADQTELAVHLSERTLSQEIELHEEIAGTLDGQLSLVNATHYVEI